ADVLAELSRSIEQRTDVARGIRRFADRVIVDVSRALARSDASVKLDELAAQVKPQSLLVESSPQGPPDVGRRHRVQRPSNLHVVIGMHLYVGPARDIERRIRSGQQVGSLFALEYFARHS